NYEIRAVTMEERALKPQVASYNGYPVQTSVEGLDHTGVDTCLYTEYEAQE
ncbi:17662_t:CDS:1, partial [Funneliformis caledonium]